MVTLNFNKHSDNWQPCAATDAAVLHPLWRQRHSGGHLARRPHARHAPEPPRPGLQRRRRHGQGTRQGARTLCHGGRDPRRHREGHGEYQVKKCYRVCTGSVKKLWTRLCELAIAVRENVEERIVERGIKQPRARIFLPFLYRAQLKGLS